MSQPTYIVTTDQPTTVVVSPDQVVASVPANVQGPAGPAGPAPAGTGLVRVTDGVASTLTHPSPSPAGTFNLATLTIDAFGRVTAASNGTVTAATITDSTAVGRAVLTAADAAAARSAIGAGNALTSGTLAQFAATTSAELAGVLTDETGFSAGAVVVFSASPTLTGTVNVANLSASGTGSFNVSGGSSGHGLTVGDSVLVRPAAGSANGTSSYQLWSNAAASRAINFGMTVPGLSPSNGDLIFSSFAGSWAELWRSHEMSNLTGSHLHVTISSAQRRGLTIRGAGSQTGNLLQCENNAASVVTSVSAGGNITTAGTVFVGTYTVATLPSASANAGAFAQVTDSNSTTNGGIVAGGGSNRVPVFSNGTNWIIK